MPVLIQPCRIVIVLGPSVWGGEDPPPKWMASIKQKWGSNAEVKYVKGPTRALQIKIAPRPGSDKDQLSADKEKEHMKQTYKAAHHETVHIVETAPTRKPGPKD